jgi:membrane protease YdiL (CAAX protease family)
MSISTISQSQMSAASTVLNIEDVKKNLCNPLKWLYLVPTIGTMAIGILFAPNFAIGLAAGGAISLIGILSAVTLASLDIMKTSDEDSEYAKQIRAFPLFATIVAPVGEELVFRGAMQPLLTKAIVSLAPAAAVAFLGTSLSIATSVAIAASAALFGFVHIFNEHEHSYIQAIVTAIQGVALGILAAQFGLAASIAAHMTTNTILITLGKLCHQGSETTTSGA